MTVDAFDGRAARRPVSDLISEALRLVEQQGRVPPRYLFMRALKIGPKKADELLDLLEKEETIVRIRKDEKMKEVENVTAQKDEKMKALEAMPEKDETTTEVVAGEWAEAVEQSAEVQSPSIESHKIAVEKDEKMNRPVKQGMSLTNLRWLLRFVLILGVVVSIAGNILDADNGHPVSQAIKAWSPLALLIVIECISLVPVYTTMLVIARRCATTGIALIAAWVSYWHMVSVCVKYGENGGSEYLIPLSVDGLVVVATICLVEISGQINAARRNS